MRKLFSRKTLAVVAFAFAFAVGTVTGTLIPAPEASLVSDLKASGWTASPNDGCECLHAPK